ncbi:MAG: sensor histidine kinase, partial [Acetobacteraceae bacterium]|nr:sensor histidine kinase [Acetobacteraceae bacterium]
FLTELCGPLFQAMGETEGERIHLEIDAPELQMSSDQAVPLSLIVTEAVTNAIKYAYPAGRPGTISIKLTRIDDEVELDIHDDGVGIPAGRIETEAGPRDGIGIQLINGFARQLGAKLEVQEGNGTRYLVRMKLRRDRLDTAPLGADRAP